MGRSRRRAPQRSPGSVEVIPLGPFEVPGVGHRRVRVCLPTGMWGARRRPPLLVMWDGQNVFEDEPSFAGGWHLHALSDRRARAYRRAPVIAAIDHGGLARNAELNPYGSPLRPGRLPALLHWVSEALVPFLRARFKLAAGPENTIVGGASMGGLAALYAHLARPDVFGGAWAMSPSLHPGRGGIFHTAAQVSKPWRTQIYLDAGGREGGGGLVQGGAHLARALRERGWGDEELMWYTTRSGTHSERHWRARSPRAMRFFFG